MASDNHASFARIGFIIVIGIVGIIATLFYIGGLRGGGDELLVETYYEKSVSGLAVGSPVNFRGVKIGEVREISFVGSKYEVSGRANHYIYVLVAIDRGPLGAMADEPGELEAKLERLVREFGLRAVVTASGITGLSRVECNLFRSPSAPMEISWTPRHFYVPGQASLLDDFSDAATRVMNQLNTMDFQAMWSNLNSSVQSLAHISESLNHSLDSYQPQAERIFANIEETAAALREFSERVKNDPSLVIRGGSPERLDETR